MFHRSIFLITICLLATLAAPAIGWAAAQDQESVAAEQQQEADETTGEDTAEPAKDSFFETTTVTATGAKVDVFDIATSVAVIPAEVIEQKMPENPVDLFREQPGVDVNGVGPNQARPIIRGQRGLRVLFMENGLRMNNARRQSDFGEASGLVDLDNVQTMEQQQLERKPSSAISCVEFEYHLYGIQLYNLKMMYL